MSNKQIQEYYDTSENRDVRPDLVSAISLLDDTRLLRDSCWLADSRIAIDCGCGAGSDIEFLRKNDFTVHAFDLEEESIRRCSKRFKGDDKVILSVDSFRSFVYPNASLIVADASLLFCLPSEFEQVWASIKQSLINRGVFCGSFLGPRDTMAISDYSESGFWPAGRVFTEAEVRKNFDGFDIAKFNEIELSGETDQGIAHHWHLFTVVAQKHQLEKRRLRISMSWYLHCPKLIPAPLSLSHDSALGSSTTPSQRYANTLGCVLGALDVLAHALVRNSSLLKVSLLLVI